MSQQRQIESPDNTKQQIAHDESRPDSARSFEGGFHPSPQLQRTLGNRNVAKLIQGTPQGKFIGFRRKLTVGAAVDRYEQAAGAGTIAAGQSVRLSRGDSVFGLQRQAAGGGIGRQEKEKCIRKWEKEPEEMSIHAAEHFATTEIDSNLSLRFATVE